MNKTITAIVVFCFLLYWVLEYQHQIRTSREWISKQNRRILGAFIFGSYAMFMGLYIKNTISEKASQKLNCEEMSCEKLSDNGELIERDGRIQLSFHDSYYIEEKDQCMMFAITSYLKKSEDGYLLEDYFQEQEPVRTSNYAVKLDVTYNSYVYKPDKLEAYIDGNDEIIHISGYIYEQSGRPVTLFDRRYLVSLNDPVKVGIKRE